MSRLSMDIEPPAGFFWHYLPHFLKHGQKLLVYPGAYTYAPARHPRDLKTPTIHDGIPHLTPLLRTPDGADLACFLLPQTRASLDVYGSSEHERASRSHDLQTQTQTYRNQRRKEKSTIQPSEKEIDDAHVQCASASVEIPAAAASARATVLMFFGNAAQNWEDIPIAEQFYALGCNVFLVSYRGFAFSTGTPSERGLQIDAQTALDYVLSQPYLARTPIILHGWSLGGAVAVHLASQNPSKITALILTNTFPSLPVLLRSHSSLPLLFRLCVRLGMCSQTWDSERKMRIVRKETRVMLIGGGRDSIVPPEMMERVWVAVKGRGRRNESRQEKGEVGTRGRWWRWWKRGRESKAEVKGDRDPTGCLGSLRRKIKKWLRWRDPKALADSKEAECRHDSDENADLDYVESTRDVFVKIPDASHHNAEEFSAYWTAVREFIDEVSIASRSSGWRYDCVSNGSSASASVMDTPVPVRRRWENDGGDLVVCEESESGVSRRVVVLP